jgi:uracil-DNA glycosylase family 4
MKFYRDTACTRCNLCESTKARCIPTELYGPQTKYLGKRAILVVGEAPGGNEETQERPWVGKAGQTLRKLYIDFFKFDDRVDVYLGNAVRCRPPGNSTPNKTQLKSCHGFLLADVVQLQWEYDEVIVLVAGAPAASAVLGLSLTKSFRKQGEFTDWHNLLQWDQTPSPKTGKPKKLTNFELMAMEMAGFEFPKPCRVFSTYHPSYLLREPSNGPSVKRHLQMLSDYLDGKLDYELDDLLNITEGPRPPSYSLECLSFDIETYGIVKNQPKQRYFHPHKSHHLDHCCVKDLCQTTGLTWRDPQGELKHAIFFMDNVTHRRRLWAWIEKCRKDPNFKYLLGQNIVFDLMYLRYCYPECRLLLDDPLPVLDLMILNYLHDESRPEKSLKALAPLFRITKYGEGNGTGEFKRYSHRHTPKLVQYNCQDTAATLLLAEKIMQEIAGFYGSGTKKLSPFCMKWYSQLLWLVVWMSETGLHMDEGKLRTLLNRYEKANNAIMRAARELYGMPLRGEGSEKAKRGMMDNAVAALESCNIPTPELETTDKKQEIRFSADNRNALMDVMPHDWYAYKWLKLFGAYQDVSGMLDRYLYPLLVGGGPKHDRKDSVLLDSRSYPRWFPVPSQYEDESSGGTKQARIVAKGPPCQTFPPSVKKTMVGRFSDGWMLWFDYSQIELRVAALLSGDEAMMVEYLGKPDLHGATAKLMFPDYVAKGDRDCKSGCKCRHCQYRQAGKTFNFRGLFRGGVKKAQSSLMQDLGIFLSLEHIARIDAAFWRKHRTLRQWQDGVVEFVMQHGYYELPLIGQSRLFLGGKKARERKLSEIVNLPVQATAADIMLSAQYHLWAKLRQAGLKALVPCNIYDAALIECPKYEIHRVRQIMAEVLPNPPFYTALCQELGRSLPLDYDIEETRIPA